MDGAIHSGERAATECAAALACAETASVEPTVRASAPTLPTGRDSFGHAPPLGLAHAAFERAVARSAVLAKAPELIRELDNCLTIALQNRYSVLHPPKRPEEVLAMTKRLMTVMVAVAAVAALAVFASACGDDDTEATATMEQPETSQPAEQDVVVLAQGERNLSTLVEAVTAAELVDTLKAEGPYTVFAPNNKAFAALGQEQLSELLQPENRDQLKSILTYHVVPGELTADRLKDGQQLETVEGQSLTVSINGGTVKIDDATVVRPDVNASNGVAHVIDGVLTPSA